MILPYAVVNDYQGNLYISDTGKNYIRMVNGDWDSSVIVGNSMSTIPGDDIDEILSVNIDLSRPKSMAIDVRGSIYVADIGNRKIRKFTRNACKVGYYGEHGIAQHINGSL